MRSRQSHISKGPLNVISYVAPWTRLAREAAPLRGPYGPYGGLISQQLLQTFNYQGPDPFPIIFLTFFSIVVTSFHPSKTQGSSLQPPSLGTCYVNVKVRNRSYMLTICPPEPLPPHVFMRHQFSPSNPPPTFWNPIHRMLPASLFEVMDDWASGNSCTLVSWQGITALVLAFRFGPVKPDGKALVSVPYISPWLRSNSMWLSWDTSHFHGRGSNWLPFQRDDNFHIEFPVDLTQSRWLPSSHTECFDLD